MIVAPALGAFVAGALAHGAFYPNSPIFGRVIARVGDDEPIVALTFDDGPNPEATPAILDALASRDVKASFFILGRHAQRWPELVRRIAREGHQVCNHGYYHRKLHFKSPGYVRNDLRLGTEAIVDACGVRPAFFRAPHGFRSPWVTSIARSLGQRTVGWGHGVWDTALPGVEVIADRTVRVAKPGSILLLHDGDGYDPLGDRMQTARAVPLIIDRIRGAGLEFATLEMAA
jgi:peptidoglycan/xylan/chitin deacetylase (PgdA/CDA1 family)